MSSFALHQNGDCVDDLSIEQLPPLEYDDFGEPEILPRIGDEYQAELPPLIQEPNRMSYYGVGSCSFQDFFVGLPIPLIWIKCEKNEGPQTILDSKHPHYKNTTKMTTFCNGDIVKSKEKINNPVGKEKTQMCSNKGHLLVPGLLSERWSDAEKASFVLALYIFQKNFVEVRQFVESKNMGAILSFYYGEFYGSDVYHRWSEGWKTRSKKCVYGQRIFSGSRQQELISRLLHKVSEDCQSSLLKVSKTFSEEKISLVEYVSCLKAMVGKKLLVEAIGVGSGKADLTRMGLEPLKSNQVARSEIPAGTACSALTTAEIIKFLSGDYRLSKARSNDLFWEAVWPRLLARGWHSEQPQSKGTLVFLLPGVKKFSTRKLVKGDHYFDSVTDVLSKVAKDPTLIELDNEDQTADVKEEEESDRATRERHSYLQPRTPKRTVDAIKFTVVDTSLSGSRIIELRSLPREISSMLISYEASDKEDTGESVYPVVSKPLKKKKKKDSNGRQKPQNVSKSVSRRKQKVGNGDNVGPTSKRFRKLNGNSDEEARDGCCSWGAHENLCNQVSSSKDSRIESSEENPQGQLLIDLNLPHVDLECDNETSMASEAADKQSIQIQTDSNGLEEQPRRRLSTRYRPPTTRALEAVASGYMSIISRKRKGRDGARQPSQKPHVSNESPTSSVASQIATTSGNSNTDNKLDDASEANQQHLASFRK